MLNCKACTFFFFFSFNFVFFCCNAFTCQVGWLEHRDVDQGGVAKSSVQPFLFQKEALSAFCHSHQKKKATVIFIKSYLLLFIQDMVACLCSWWKCCVVTSVSVKGTNGNFAYCEEIEFQYVNSLTPQWGQEKNSSSSTRHLIRCVPLTWCNCKLCRKSVLVFWALASWCRRELCLVQG